MRLGLRSSRLIAPRPSAMVQLRGARRNALAAEIAGNAQLGHNRRSISARRRRPMRWEDYRRSDNVEDRRDERGGFETGGMQIPLGRGGLGIGGLIIVGIIALALGIDPSVLIGNLDQVMNQPQFEQRGRPPMRPDGPTRPSAQPKAAPTDQTGQFVAAVLAQTEDMWKQVFKQSGQTYREPCLV